MNIVPLTREQWLNECADLIMNEIIHPVWIVRDSMSIKVSVGYAPNTKAGSKTIGVCLSSACSANGYNEIFISPVINDSLQVLGTLAHELIHAVDDCKNGHKGPFVNLMHKIGLEGKPTATVPSKALADHLAQFVDLLGPIPHAKVDLSTQKRQQNRNIKVQCSDESCGFKFNTSRAQINYVLELHGEVICPACGHAMDCPEL